MDTEIYAQLVRARIRGRVRIRDRVSVRIRVTQRLIAFIAWVLHMLSLPYP